MNLKQANQLFQQEKYEEALSIYKKIITENPSLQTVLEFNINYARTKLSKNPLNSNKVDILATIWLSSDEPIHDIVKEALQLLDYKSFNSKLFAPEPLLNRAYSDISYLQTQPASIYLSKSIIPSGTRLPISCIESNKELISYLLKEP